jgi:uncharacterized integral membrane protein
MKKKSPVFKLVIALVLLAIFIAGSTIAKTAIANARLQNVLTTSVQQLNDDSSSYTNVKMTVTAWDTLENAINFILGGAVILLLLASGYFGFKIYQMRTKKKEGT